VVSPTTFTHPEDTFVVADRVLDDQEIPESKGGKWVHGGNLGVKLSAVREGRIPAFFIPKDSRGEDTIFSLGLTKAKVHRVRAGIFHDAFGTYSQISTGHYPDKLEFVDPPGNRAFERFANVLHGWLAYAPLLEGLRHPTGAYQILQDSASALRRCEHLLFNEVPGLAEGWRSRPSPSDLLVHYTSILSLELERYRRTQRLWQQLVGTIQPAAFLEP
jgi:hypothetical protein